MRIKTIMCSSDQDFYELHSKRCEALSTDEVQIKVAYLPHGPVSMESAYDEAVAAPYILQHVASAEAEGFDAVIVDCAADPAGRAAKEIADIPVVSAGEAGFYTAMLIASKFSVVTILQSTVHEIEDHIAVYGIGKRVASVLSADVPVLSLDDTAYAEEKIYAASKKAIEEDGAQAIVLGCTGMMEMCESLEKRLGVPVIEPYSAAIQQAASLVRLGKRQSRLSYIKAGHKKVN